MSKIGKKPIILSPDVRVTLREGIVAVSGPKGEVAVPRLPGINVATEEKQVIVSPQTENKNTKSNWGTQRALIYNAVHGVVNGFEKTLFLEGVGYRMAKEGDGLTLYLGFSHPIKYKVPQGIICEIEKNSLKIKGIDKEKVGQVAAEIRALKKPEPYKGKGFRYSDETIRRKAGKKAIAATGTK